MSVGLVVVDLVVVCMTGVIFYHVLLYLCTSVRLLVVSLVSFARQVCRVVAEIQTRAAMLLALYMNNVDFAKLYISQCGSSLDMLKVLAKDCSTGNCP